MKIDAALTNLETAQSIEMKLVYQTEHRTKTRAKRDLSLVIMTSEYNVCLKAEQIQH